MTSIGAPPALNRQKLWLQNMSGTSLFLIWMIGLLIELDVFHNKKNIPLVKSNHIGPQILFWAVLVITSFIAFGVFYSSISTDFKLAMEQVDTSKTETNKATETISEVTETSLSVDVKMRKIHPLQNLYLKLNLQMKKQTPAPWFPN